MTHLIAIVLFVVTTGWSWTERGTAPPGFAIGLSLAMGATSGGIGAFLFAFVRSAMAPVPPLELAPGEALLATIPSNHRRGIEYRGGAIHLGDQGLLFRPHRFNFQRQELHLPWASMERVEWRPSQIVGAAGLVLIHHAGGVERFRVFDVRAVANVISALAQAPVCDRAAAVGASSIGGALA